MDKFCFSCGAPLNEQFVNTVSDKFCKYCSDESGKLKESKIVQAGIAEWLKMIDPSNTSSDYIKRAGFYMKAMPVWADD